MQKRKLLALAMTLFIISSCQKQNQLPQKELSSEKYVISGNYKPTSKELEEIRLNLENLSKSTLTEIVNKTRDLNQRQSSLKISTAGSSNVYKKTLDDNSGSYLQVTTSFDATQFPDYTTPDYGGGFNGGTPIIYNWVMGVNYFKLFTIESSEKVSVLFKASEPESPYRYQILKAEHSSSYLNGLYGPSSWAETSNLNSFAPDNGTTAYFYCAGILSVPGAGGTPVKNSRYASAYAIWNSHF